MRRWYKIERAVWLVICHHLSSSVIPVAHEGGKAWPFSREVSPNKPSAALSVHTVSPTAAPAPKLDTLSFFAPESKRRARARARARVGLSAQYAAPLLYVVTRGEGTGTRTLPQSPTGRVSCTATAQPGGRRAAARSARVPCEAPHLCCLC